MSKYKIALHGAPGTGKDTVARFLCDNRGFIRNAFADPLKRAAQQMFMLTDEQTWNDDLKDIEIPYWGMTPRRMFQLVGTEGGREVFGKDLWLRRWSLHFSEYRTLMHYVTPDVRFENEATLLRDLGFTLIHLIGRNWRNVQVSSSGMAHSSENGVAFRPDLGDVRVYNDHTRETLQWNIDAVLHDIDGVTK